jgi:hypothetical protein
VSGKVKLHSTCHLKLSLRITLHLVTHRSMKPGWGRSKFLKFLCLLRPLHVHAATLISTGWLMSSILPAPVSLDMPDDISSVSDVASVENPLFPLFQQLIRRTMII